MLAKYRTLVAPCTSTDTPSGSAAFRACRSAARQFIAFFLPVAMLAVCVAPMTVAAFPAWVVDPDQKYEDIVVNGKPIAEIQADGIPKVDLDQFRVIRLPKVAPPLTRDEANPFKGGAPFKDRSIPDYQWLDDHRLIASTRRLGAWRAGPGELPKLIVLDLNTRQITDTGFTGDLVCVKSSGAIVLTRRAVDGAGPFLLGRVGRVDLSDVQIGTLADGFHPYVEPGAPHTVNFDRPEFVWGTCEPAPDRAALPNGASLSVYRLWPGDMLLARLDRGDALLPPGSPILPRTWHVFDRQGRQLSSWDHACKWTTWPGSQAGIRYLPQIDAYVTSGPGSSGPARDGEQCPYVMVTKQGQIRPVIYEPPLLKKWGRTRHAYVTGTGLAWYVAQKVNENVASWSPEFEGLYVMKDYELIQVLRAEIDRSFGVSPDGCRIVLVMLPIGSVKRETRGDFGHLDRVSELAAIDFCEGNK